MKLKYNTEKLQRIAADIYYSTGISVSFFKSNFSACDAQKTSTNGYCRAIRGYPGVTTMCARFDNALLAKCKEERRMVAERCHGGLLNIAAPMMHEGMILGYVVLYSIRTESFSGAPECISDYSYETDELMRLYNDIKIFDSRTYEAVCNIATLVAKYVMLENLIELKTNENLERIESYIADNLDKELSVKQICKNTNVSKSVLYKLFNDSLGCTVSEYVNRQRITLARRLLTQSDMAIDELAKKVGYSSPDYFGRVFKKLVGTSPNQYRKKNGFI